MTLPKYYNILGLSNQNPSEEELKKAYKKAALKYHPDRNQNDKENAEQKFKEVAEAYSVLSDKNKKHIYDSYGEDGLKSGVPTNNFDFNSMNGNNIFRNNGSSFVFSTSSNNHFDIDPHEIFSQFFNNNDMQGFNINTFSNLPKKKSVKL